MSSNSLPSLVSAPPHLNLPIKRGPWKGGMLVQRRTSTPGIYRVVKRNGSRPRILGLPVEAVPYWFISWMVAERFF